MSKNTTLVSLPPDAQARLEMLVNQGKVTTHEDETCELAAAGENA
jgi:hypothetical protein